MSSRWTQVCGGQCGTTDDHQLISIVSGDGRMNRPATQRCLTPRLCVTAVVTVAFVVGIVIGLLLPIATPPTSPSLIPLLASRHDDKKSLTPQPFHSAHTSSSFSVNRTAVVVTTRTFGDVTMTTPNPFDSLKSEQRPPMSRRHDRYVNGSDVQPLGDSMSVTSLVSDGVYWSPLVEAALPTGFSEEDNWRWTLFADEVPVVKVAEGCGRMQNRLLVFENGTKACCRYRQNNDQIQGEIFSFHLAHLLGLRNLPPATLGLLFGREWQWRSVRGQLTLAQWNEQKPVVMTQFVDDLVPAYIPAHFRGDDRRLHPVDDDLGGLSGEQVLELAQWSDLVIFDYLTANLDRVVNNMYNKQWNPDMMAAPAHNLAKVAKTGLLVFLDNESGLLHGYRLLDKYEAYHRTTLSALCVFRSSTVRAVRALRAADDGTQVGRRLKEALRTSQPHMMDWLPLLPDKSVKILRERLGRVDEQVRECERRFGDAQLLVETLIKPSPLTA